uniref:F-box domain-containing protein n=1 Tax=Steinernema glaseri TaxID=37863 RepID=A0A1I7YUL7_9BILA
MDHLFYDLVEEIVGYLPREDVDTIAYVAKRCQELKNWSAAAEDQLENRFLLDVAVVVDENAPKVYLCAKKTLPDGSKVYWDFTRWRYAWIKGIVINGASVRNSIVEADVDQVLRTVSLPIQPSDDLYALRVGRLSISLPFGQYSDCDNLGAPHRDYFVLSPESSALALRILQVVQKEFTIVDMNRAAFEDPSGICLDFITDYLAHGPNLETLFYYHGHQVGKRPEDRRIWPVIAPLFAQERGAGKELGGLLNLRLVNLPFKNEDIERIVESWWQSDGILEPKSVGWDRPRNTLLRDLKKKYSCVEHRDGAYIPHPTRESSMYVTKKYIRVMKYRPWHVPVDFKWIDSVIDEWMKGEGYLLWHGKTRFFFTFKSKDDWTALVEKYGPAVGTDGRLLSIPHPHHCHLEVSKEDGYFAIETMF